MIHIVWILSILYRIPNYFLFFKHCYQYNIYVNIYISLTIKLLSHIVSRLHIHDTLVSISTNTMRLYNVVVTYYHTSVYVTRKNFIVAINKYKVEYHLILYFKRAVVFIVSSTAVLSCCSLFYIYHIFFSFNQIITLFRYSLTFHFRD